MKKTIVWFLVIIMGFGLMTLTGCNTEGVGSGDSMTGSAAASSAVSTRPASDAEVFELIVQNHDPADSICGQYVEAWGKAVEDASDGHIKLTYYHDGSLVGADDAVNAVLNGTADICWSAATIYSGQFPISEFIQLPLSGINCARMGCDVMQDMYKEVSAFRAEYSGFKVIMLGSCTYAPVSTAAKKPINVQDIQGLRIRAPGSTSALWCSTVGMSPMTVATPETYKSLENGVVVGCLNDWHNISALKLYENLDYIMDYPTPGSPIFMLMNKAKYASMPSELQAVIDRYSDEYASTMAGIYWDSTRAWIYDNAKEFGVEIYEPSNELYAHLSNAEVEENVHKQYIEYLNGFGLDGQAIYDQCMEIVSRYTAAYDEPWANSVRIEDFKG